MADNVSNSNTAGFKAGLPQFSDLLARGEGSVYDLARTSAGDGAMIDRVKSIFTQGGLEPTESPYDLAVDGNGFFVLARPGENGEATSELLYSRAGNFQLDQKGRLVNAQGLLVMAFSAQGDGKTLEPITLSGRDAKPVATTVASVVGNLSADTAVESVAVPAKITSTDDLAPFNPFVNSIRVIDSLSGEHDIQLAFFKTGIDASGVTTWDVRALADGKEVAGGTAGAINQIGSLGQLKIGADGKVIGAATLTATANWVSGGASAGVAIDLANFTGYSTQSFISATNRDGTSAGVVDGVEFENNGAINVVLSSGERTKIGTIALADVPNEAGLERSGNTVFSANADAGSVTYDAPRVGGRGTLAQSTVETSNVDLADQFINVIRIQRTYQAGSQLIQTANDLLNTTIQIA